MNLLSTALVVAALLGSALIGGIFFTFSSFVMKALSLLPRHEGMAAMQSINVVVLNPSFLGVFMGTALISVLVAILAMTSWGTPSATCFLTGAVLYIVGTFLVTGLGNVPLNNRLAAASGTDPEAIGLWDHYLTYWTFLNTIRTGAAVAAALAFTIGLLQNGSV